MRVLPCGERAVLLEVADQRAAHALARALAGAPGVIDVVPASRTVLVTSEDPDGVRALAAGLPLDEASTAEVGEEVVIDVRYDGEDLDEVARLTGLTRAEVIARHTGATYTADFLGFAPGFAYLSGLDPALHVARLDTPRTSVPAGAVAIAGDKAAVYPRSSPGGWRLLGHTGAVLFDPEVEPPALLQAGARVRFREVG
ncbi:allophanate hydrolase subunit 1 [Ruania suaedae]|uniref:5-oxoprolinase subunit B family protein n=1 Tax=Ruania suaedae TaxID=2897774 RepID=UPI001E2DE86E|nr:allophanate hydrolase subunit 1 [Ruania suaedae]UFU02077.1 allophanate hydrolase subunit 1 [Ruania suaedae]